MKLVLVFIVFVSFLFASIDINNADQKEFSSLSGIGAKKAAAIVSFRLKNGCFKTIDTLSKVKGIGKKTIDKNRDNLTVGKCKQ